MCVLFTCIVAIHFDAHFIAFTSIFECRQMCQKEYSYSHITRWNMLLNFDMDCTPLQDKEKVKTETSGLRRRLEQAEKGLVDTKEECIKLTNAVQDLERKVNTHS